MKCIKISYKIKNKKGTIKGKTTIVCQNGHTLTKFGSADMGKFAFDALKEQGKPVIFNRGVVIQAFKGKNYEEVAEIMRKDIKLGLAVASEKSPMELEDYKEELIEK